MRNHSLILLAALLPSVAFAQADPSRGTVEGTVYDSVARRPLAGALVQMANATALSSPLLSARTDDRGRYAIRDVPPGRYLIGFQDAALDSLALDATQTVLEMGAGARARVDLAIPSPERIVGSACNAQPADSTALILGVLRDATTGTLRSQGSVEARWADILIERMNISRQQQSLVGPVSEEGWFAVCVPSSDAILLRAQSGADSSGVQLVAVGPNAIARRDIVIGGRAVVRGQVRSHKEKPVANAQVAFAGTERVTTTDSSGSFVLSGPAGSHTFEVRALGHAADRRAISLPANADTVIHVALVPLNRVLDTVQVIASRVFSRDSDGFEQRRRARNGRFWSADDMTRGRFHNVYDALRQAPSISITQNGFSNRMSMRGGMYGRCAPAIFLNGLRVQSDLGSDLDLIVSPQDISGMELYSAAQVPAQYQALVGCGSLVIWTRPRPKR